MVKGTSRQVIVVRPPERGLFEQAIFLIRDGALPRQGVTEEDILKEANAAADTYLHRRMERKNRITLWRGMLWAAAGAAPRNAFESQALLQLATEYCAAERCAECPVGRRILQKIADGSA